MIVRVWGVVNRTEVEFTQIQNKPGWYEGYAPKGLIYQDIEIWAKNDRGAIGHLKTQVVIREWSPTEVQIILTPYVVELLDNQNRVLYNH